MCVLEQRGWFLPSRTGCALEGLGRFLLELGGETGDIGELYSAKSNVVSLHSLATNVIHLSKPLDICVHKMEGIRPSVGMF